MVQTIYRLYGTAAANKYLRQEAQRLIGYFAGCAKFDGAYWGLKGEKTAREWLRLMNTEEPAPDELLTLLGVARANKHCSSMWVNLAGGIYFWVQLKGATVPPTDIFFHSDQIPFEKTQIFTPLDYANYLNEHFAQNCQDDPGYEPWMQGLAVSQDWLKLINAQEVTQFEARSLVEKMTNPEGAASGSGLWYDLLCGVIKWCKSIGYLEVVPEHLHYLLGIVY